MQEFQIEFYEKIDGTEPAKDFILSLDTKMRAKVLRTVSLLGDSGPTLREPYCFVSHIQNHWMMEFLKFAPSLALI